jgi:bacteriocin-like protein
MANIQMTDRNPSELGIMEEVEELTDEELSSINGGSSFVRELPWPPSFSIVIPRPPIWTPRPCICIPPPPKSTPAPPKNTRFVGY